MTHEDFVTFEQAKALKEMGFDWEVVKGYSHFPGEKVKTFYAQEENVNAIYSKWCFAAPSLSQAQKWLCEVKGIAPNIIAHDGGFYHCDDIYLPNAEYAGYFPSDPTRYSTYEQALSAGIDKALELLKSENNGK